MKLQQKKSKKNITKWFFTLIILGALAWGITWATFARVPLPEAVKALESDGQIEVTQDPWLVFSPKRGQLETGFIFYPGGRINPQGYATLMRAIALEGTLVVVPNMPINMAVFNANVADDIMAYFPDIEDWVIGGHSVGGTMAAQYAHQHPELVKGLVIWASYPAENANLSNYDIPVLSIYGTLDPRVNDDSIRERKHLLPDDTQYTRIEGGDHHQFGSYEIKPGEHFATINRDSQQREIIQATLNLLRIVAINENE